ncbi:MAG: ABC transporter substrate-binding protein [Cyanophyceae cyanobacterium]
MKTLIKQGLALQMALLASLTFACGQNTPEPTASVDQTESVAEETTTTEEMDPALDRDGEGGTLTIGMSAGNIPYPNTPPNEGYEGYRFVANNIYDALTAFDLDQGEEVPAVIPGLAERWELADDQVTWTFYLREGVTFHDGTPFNAEAVEFQFNRVSNEDFEYFDPNLYGGYRTYTQEIASYRVIDEYTFEITTVRPFSFFPEDMAHIKFPSPTAVMEYGNEEYINHASGTGPFKVVNYVDGEVLELEANEDYWGGRPKLDTLVLRPFAEPASRLAALLSGDIDWAEVPPPDALSQLYDQDFNVLLHPYPHTIVLAINHNQEPFNDLRVRQALQYAIDRESMCDSLLNGACIPAYQYIYEGHQWYDEEFGDTYARDLDKAKELLAEAGYADGLTIRMAYPTGGSGNMWPGPMMELMQANFKEIGVEMEIVPLEWNNIIGMARAGVDSPEYRDQYDGFFISWAFIAPSQLTRFTTPRIPPNGCCNSMHYSSAETDALHDQAVATFDQEERDQLLSQMMGQAARDSSVIFVVHDLNLRVLNPDVRGFIQPKSWWADFTQVWVRE